MMGLNGVSDLWTNLSLIDIISGAYVQSHPSNLGRMNGFSYYKNEYLMFCNNIDQTITEKT